AAEAAKKAGNVQRAATLTKAARADLGLQGFRLGAEGTILGAAYTPESGFGDVDARIENAATGLATGAAVPWALRGAGKAISAPAIAGKKILRTVGGVSEDVIERYLQNPERIRNAKSFDELYDEVSGVVRTLADDLDLSRIDYDAAKTHLDEIASSIKNSSVETKSEAMGLVRSAQDQLDDALRAEKSRLSERASGEAIEPMVTDAVGNLKDSVIHGSSAAFDILGNKSVSAAKAYDFAVKLSQELSERGSDAAKSASKKLKDYADLIYKRGQTDGDDFQINAQELKKIVQDIDADVGVWSKGTGSFDDPFTK